MREFCVWQLELCVRSSTLPSASHLRLWAKKSCAGRSAAEANARCLFVIVDEELEESVNDLAFAPAVQTIASPAAE